MKFTTSLKIIGSIVVIFSVSSAYVRAFTVAAASMSPTFLVGDLIVSNHAAYDLRLPYLDVVLLETGEPQQGDLIMYFDIPKNVIATKRIIGLPGDAVRMENNVLYINGIEAKQHEVSHHIFALGDHRDNSADSRYIGVISREQIKGRVFQGDRTFASYAKS